VDKPPIAFCELITAPVLILQGDKDVITPPAQADMLNERLLAFNKDVELIVFEGAAHGFTYEGAPAVNVEYDEATAAASLDAVKKFIRKHLDK
jgi:dipeptidyl aminopeptidase/acylaminoacyl peptidase